MSKSGNGTASRTAIGWVAGALCMAAMSLLSAGCGSGPGGEIADCVPGSGVVVMCPMTITVGQAQDFFGMHLGGNRPVTFTDATGKSVKVTPNIGDDQSIEVTIPNGLAPGPITVTVYNGECNTHCTTTLK